MSGHGPQPGPKSDLRCIPPIPPGSRLAVSSNEPCSLPLGRCEGVHRCTTCCPEFVVKHKRAPIFAKKPRATFDKQKTTRSGCPHAMHRQPRRSEFLWSTLICATLVVHLVPSSRVRAATTSANWRSAHDLQLPRAAPRRGRFLCTPMARSLCTTNEPPSDGVLSGGASSAPELPGKAALRRRGRPRRSPRALLWCPLPIGAHA